MEILKHPNNQNNFIALWECINEMSNKDKMETKLANIKLNNSSVTKNNLEKCNAFNAYLGQTCTDKINEATNYNQYIQKNILQH